MSAPTHGPAPTREELPLTNPPLRASLAGFFGTTLEWYDYFLYGSAAALVFPRLFFAGLGETVGTIVSLATFSVAFLLRPVGGIIFGHFGDRVGRKSLLIITLSLMGVTTAGIGLVPGYNQIGIWGAVLLTLGR